MTVVDVFSPGHVPASFSIQVLRTILWFSLSVQSLRFFSQIKNYPLSLESPCFVCLLRCCLPSERDASGGENVHCPENVRPLLRRGKQSLYWLVECVAVLLCQKSPVWCSGYALPYCKLKFKVLVWMLLCVTGFSKLLSLLFENAILLVMLREEALPRRTCTYGAVQ